MWDSEEKKKGKGLGKKGKEAPKHISPISDFARTSLTLKYKDLQLALI